MLQSPASRLVPVVLIADDDPNVRDLLRQTLARDAYTIVEAADGPSTLEVFEETQPDLVLLDLMMPDLNGIEVCRQIQTLPDGRYVPVLMITAVSDKRFIGQSFEAGATDYITKPIDVVVLRQRVRRHLRARQAEAELRDSEARLRSIISISADAVVLVDSSNGICLFNPSAEKIFNYRAGEIQGQALDQLLPQGIVDLAPDETARASFKMETTGRRKDGTEFMAEVSIGAIEVRGQQMHAVTVRDITARIEMERALRREKDFVESLIDTAPVIIMVLDRQGQVVRFNRYMENLAGYSLDELQGQPYALIFLPEADRESFAGQFLIGVHGATAQSRISPLIARDGQHHKIEWYIAPLADTYGEPIGSLCVGQDVTERLRNESQIKRLNLDLQRRAAELAALDKAGRAMVSSLDLRQVLAVVVDEIRSLLDAEGSSVLLRDPVADELVFAAAVGHPGAQHLVGTRVPITAGLVGWVAREGLPAVVNDARSDPRFLASMDALTGATTRSVLAVPLTYQRAVWGVIEVINKIDGAFSSQDSETLKSLALSASIAIENARLYQAEREQFRRLQESQNRLVHSEKMSALGRLIASLAHEINNPLQSVQTCLSLVVEELGGEFDPGDVRSDLEIATDAIARISDIMTRLRDLYRPVRFVTRPTDLRGVLDNVLRLTDNELRGKHIAVVRDLAADLPLIELNPDQLNQVFLNLVFNAVDAMPMGGQLRVRMELVPVLAEDETAIRPAVLIQFTDTGSGLAAEEASRVFEPFFTTKDKGTGLGLSITYEIVKSFGGEITVASEPNLGTTFSIKLPVRLA
jgi:PAS domain S-box-containing protein